MIDGFRRCQAVIVLPVLGVLATAVAPVTAQELRVGTEANYPPFNAMTPDGEFAGYDIDVAAAVCARIGRSCSFFVQDWDGLIPHLLSGRYDIIIAAMSITDERRQQIDFSIPYADVPLWVVAPLEGPLAEVETVEALGAALDGLVIGAQVSTTQADVMASLAPGADIQLYPTHDDVMLDLVSGRIDAAAADSVAFLPFLSGPEGEGYGRVGPPLTATDFPTVGHGLGIAMRLGEDGLKAEIDAAIAALRAEGVLTRLSEEWFGFDISGDP